jgi:hypothetical protein
MWFSQMSIYATICCVQNVCWRGPWSDSGALNVRVQMTDECGMRDIIGQRSPFEMASIRTVIHYGSVDPCIWHPSEQLELLLEL